MLEEKDSNLDFDGHDDLVQSPCWPSRPPKNASTAARKNTEITSHGSGGVKPDAMVVVGLEVQGFNFSPSDLQLIAGSSLVGCS